MSRRIGALALALVMLWPSAGWPDVITYPARTTIAATLNVNSLCLDAANQDACLVRDAADILAQKRGENGQEFRVYGSAAGSKYSSIKHDQTNMILNQVGGAGGIQFGIGGTAHWVVNNSGHLVAQTDNTPTLGLSGASRPATGYFGTSVALESAANGAAMGWKRVTTTVDTTNLAATITATNLIPAGSMVYQCNTRNTVVFDGTMTSFDIGDGTTANLFANDTALGVNETTNLVDHLSTFKPTLYTAATSVVVTAVGGTFGTTGTIRITCFYYDSTAPTS